MEWSTHAMSGILAGYLITGGDWKGAVVGGIAGVIPDLDEHRSKFGKIFFPISYVINKTFGHRTFTHSLLFAFLVSAVLFPFTDSWVWLAAFAGILAHIAGDMLTGTVQFLYPNKRWIGIRIDPIMFKPIDSIANMLLVVAMFFMFLHMSSNF